MKTKIILALTMLMPYVAQAQDCLPTSNDPNCVTSLPEPSTLALFAVAAIGGISLLVGAIGIVTIMTIAIKERTNEIGLLRALGAKQSQVLSLFLGEAIVLAAIGGLSGLALGIGIAQLLHLALPALPVHTPMLYVVLAEVIAVMIGLLAGVLPARRAAQLDPVEALRSE